MCYLTSEYINILWQWMAKTFAVTLYRACCFHFWSSWSLFLKYCIYRVLKLLRHVVRATKFSVPNKSVDAFAKPTWRSCLFHHCFHFSKMRRIRLTKERTITDQTMWKVLLTFPECCVGKFMPAWRTKCITWRWVKDKMKMAVRHQRNTLLTKVNFRNFGCLHHCRFGENKYLVLFLNLFQIYLDDKNEIKSSECDCPRGAFKCSHAACVFVYGIWNLSRTDVECTWKKRKTTSLSQTSIEEMFPPKKDYECLKRKPSQEDRTELYSQLRQYGRFTGLCWLMSAEPQPPKQLAVQQLKKLFSH